MPFPFCTINGMPDFHDAAAAAPVASAESAPQRTQRTRRSKWAWAITICSLLLAIAIAAHQWFPGSVGTLNASALPWYGWLLPVLLAGAVATRRRRAWLAAIAPALAWLIIVAPTALPLGGSGTALDEGSLTVATQNVRGGEGTAVESARVLAAEGAEVIALVELTGADREAAAAELSGSHPYSYSVGTVGLWSAYPLEFEKPLDLGLGWKRALSADVLAPGGTVSVYVVHAASFRPGIHTERDTMLRNLGDLVPLDVSERLIVMGDFNATTFDPALRPLLSTVSEPRTSGLSWGFTWPTSLPVARIDHIFERGLTAADSRVMSAGTSDHRAVVTRFVDAGSTR